MKKLSIAFITLLVIFLIFCAMLSGWQQICPKPADHAYICCLKILPGENPIVSFEVKDEQAIQAWNMIYQYLSEYHYLPVWPNEMACDNSVDIILTYNGQSIIITFTNDYIVYKYGSKTQTYIAMTKEPIYDKIITIIKGDA